MLYNLAIANPCAETTRKSNTPAAISTQPILITIIYSILFEAAINKKCQRQV